MDIDRIGSIVWKEFQEIRGNKSILFVAVSFPLIFTYIGMYSMFVLKDATQKTTYSNLIDNMVLYVAFLTTIYIGYILTSQLFYKEKTNKTIETLLCTPLDLKSIWLGKIIAIFSIAYLISLLFGLGTLFVINFNLSTKMIPSTIGLFLIFIVLPLLGFAVFGILGFINLWLLKPYIVNIASLLIFIAIVTSVGNNLTAISLNWSLTSMLLGFSLLLLLITGSCIRFLNKERIILTLT